MANPWTKKNPFLSIMLSGANAWAGAARGIMTGQAKRQQAAATRQSAKQVTDFWTAAMTGAAPKKRTRKKRP
ncbi:hypothetical protein BKE38_07720 [Pseudoroseomonas deserti]|uniref:Uncharacterized protein n=2 Tax=Roseomonas TaxID=125216 RepID=A0A1V2H4J1_9PROT|nr:MULTISPECIES: hypothetical protein [Acetobacteraceae]MBS5901376.1 hypothetical protein [Acetobacteraceae bacterium]APT57296.1 hypothetical protein RGI145_09455 [Roseomonas gilardii]MCG7350246.1 hypothetical protein [Roseomonas mucosa]MCG7356009.1 hypothetical protein [Roseomonas mucosa]MDT8292780.1 hypothetical protein [Roseomonas mucosa]